MSDIEESDEIEETRERLSSLFTALIHDKLMHDKDVQRAIDSLLTTSAFTYFNVTFDLQLMRQADSFEEYIRLHEAKAEEETGVKKKKLNISEFLLENGAYIDTIDRKGLSTHQIMCEEALVTLITLYQTLLTGSREMPGLHRSNYPTPIPNARLIRDRKFQISDFSR